MALKPYRSTGHWKRLRLQVLRRDAYTCAYCGGVADQVDHVWPKSRGGEDTLENCVAACKECNYAKRDKTDITPQNTIFFVRTSTRPVLRDSLSPKRANTNKSDTKQPTITKVDTNSPFSASDHIGGVGNG